MTRSYIRIILLHGASAALGKAIAALSDGPEPLPEAARLVHAADELVHQAIRGIVEGQRTTLHPTNPEMIS